MHCTCSGYCWLIPVFSGIPQYNSTNSLNIHQRDMLLLLLGSLWFCFQSLYRAQISQLLANLSCFNTTSFLICYENENLVTFKSEIQ